MLFGEEIGMEHSRDIEAVSVVPGMLNKSKKEAVARLNGSSDGSFLVVPR